MDKIAAFLSKIPLFRGIKESELPLLLKQFNAEIKRFGKDNIIYSEGDAITKIGIIISGSVQLMRNDFYGNADILARLNSGNTFGEAFCCLDEKQLTMSVVAESECEILFIEGEKMLKANHTTCEIHNKLLNNLLCDIANKNIELNRKIEFITKRSTREKLMAYLTAESQKSGTPVFSIPYDRQALADYLCVERSAMSAVLSKLKKEGIIDFHKQNFKILKDRGM